MKLETLSEAWAFFENVKSFPIKSVIISNQSEVYSVLYDSFFVEEFLDYLAPEETTICLNSFDQWSKYCENAEVMDCHGIYKFWQLPERVQRECYKIAQSHNYCNSPNSKKWAHREGI